MISINEHIRYLLTCHDCVVVPGLGAFIAQTESAYFDEVTGRFMPPQRRIGFNQRVNHDDGLLAASIVRREGVAYDTARTLIANDVAMLRSRLDSSAMAILPRLGRLDRSQGTLVFEPDGANAVAGIRYCGLSALSMTPAAAAPAPVETVEEETPALLNVDFTPRRSFRWARVAASIAVLLGLGVAISTPVLVDRSDLNYASVSAPAVIKKASVVHVPVVDNSHRGLFCVIPDAATATATVALPRTPAKVEVSDVEVKQTPKRDYAHYLIVASCESRSRAERFVSRHQADNLKVLESDGRYRVYIKASDNEASLRSRRASVAERYPGAWIYSR